MHPGMAKPAKVCTSGSDDASPLQAALGERQNFEHTGELWCRDSGFVVDHGHAEKPRRMERFAIKSVSDILRLRKHLTADQAPPVWPPQAHLLPFADAAPRALHAILADAYRNGFGSVAPFETWWASLTGDSEFDPSLVVIAADAVNRPIGLVQCWTSGFIKDIAVVPGWRGKAIGESLLLQAFWIMQQQGLSQVDLKVVAANAHAISLYRRLGMVNAPL